MQYTQENIIAMKNHSMLIQPAAEIDRKILKANPRINLVEPPHAHLIKHPAVYSFMMDIDRASYSFFENAVENAYKHPKHRDNMNELFSDREDTKKFRPQDLREYYEQVKLSEPIYEIWFDCDLLFRNKLLDLRLTNKILAADLGMLLNFWDSKGEVVFQKPELKKYGGDIAFQYLLIISNLIKDDKTLSIVIKSIRGLNNYTEELKSSIQVEQKGNQYQIDTSKYFERGDVSGNPYIYAEKESYRTFLGDKTYNKPFTRQCF
jgi:hypothetical protein